MDRSGSRLPGDPAGLHETGRIPSSLADGRVAPRAAPSSVVVGAARAVPFPAEAHTHSEISKVREVRPGQPRLGLGLVLTWSCSACCAATGPCWGLCLWRPPSATTSSRCSTSCSVAGCCFCCGTRPSSCSTSARGVPGTLTGSGGAAEPGWSDDAAWRSGRFLSCPAKNKNKSFIHSLIYFLRPIIPEFRVKLTLTLLSMSERRVTP